MMRALRPFLLSAVLALAVLAVNTYVHRSRQIAKPASADSLAGVVARVGHCDSSVVTRVTWWQSPDATLGWIKTDQYAYKDASPWHDLTPLGAEVNPSKLTVTFAKGEAIPEQIKHELVHLVCRQSNHADTALFSRIESYRGR